MLGELERWLRWPSWPSLPALALDTDWNEGKMSHWEPEPGAELDAAISRALVLRSAFPRSALSSL